MIKRILGAVFWQKKPVHLILHVTHRCNLRCKTCFVDFEKTEQGELTLAKIEEIASYLNKLIWLNIGGGEPFLRQDLPRICAAFDTKSLSIPTNGFDPHLIKEMVKEIKARIKAELTIALSIDGFENTNDAIRESGSFKKAIKTLESLKTVKGIHIKLNTVLCERNYNELIEFMKFIRKFDLDFHSIIFRRGSKNAAHSFERPAYEKLCRIKGDIFGIWDTYDYGVKNIKKEILKKYQRLMYEASLQVIKENRQIPDCLANKFHLVIWPNGDTSCCETLKPFGNICGEKINLLLKSNNAKAQRNFIKAKRCYCHHNCNLVDNFFLNPLQYPRLLSGACK